MTTRLTRVPLIFIALLLFNCLRVDAGLAYRTVAGDPLQTRIYTLDNGMKVYLAVNQNAPRIQTYVAVRVGSKHDPTETTGLAHYFEHMMFKGTTKFGTANWDEEKPLIIEIESLFEQYRQETDSRKRASIYQQIDSLSYIASKWAIPNEYSRLMNAIGATGTNAATSYDYTYYIENIPANQLENWAKIQYERFREPVLRLFHTELETVYEEKNMSLTNDMRMVSEALYKGLFPHHPYGQQTTLGEAEHLKNPSMLNIRTFFDSYYVPENMAIILSGDFDPDHAITIVDEHFGQMEARPVPELVSGNEVPIDKPVVLEVTGQQSEMIQMGWRFAGASSDDVLYIDLISSILFNGRAGLIDRHLNQPMRTRVSGASTTVLADYSILNLMGRNNAGQSLDEVRALLLEQIDRLKQGDFPEWLLEAAINNQLATRWRRTESMHNAARDIAQSFMMEVPWEAHVSYMERLGSISRDDIIEFANKHFHDNYAVVYKRQGVPAGVDLVEKPPISPIHINRDLESDFFREIMAVQVGDVEPVFIPFHEAMEIVRQEGHPDFLLVKNKDMPTFSLTFNYELGSLHDRRLPHAAALLRFLATEDHSAEEMNERWYGLASNLSMSVRRDNLRISLRGLSQHMEESLALLEELVWNAIPDDELLGGRIQQAKTTRRANKNNQQAILLAMEHHALYGDHNPSTNEFTDEELDGLTAAELIELIRSLWSVEHEVLYYGPHSMEELMQITTQHRRLADRLSPAPPAVYFQPKDKDKDRVYFVHFEANQSHLQTVAKGAAYSPDLLPVVSLYNRYFGSGMQSIVFQELREKRGLAYSARASYAEPDHTDGYFVHTSYIATQNDKVTEAFLAFDELFDQMPLSETAFQLSRDQMISNIRTERIAGDQIIFSYLNNMRMGHGSDSREALFSALPLLTLDDVNDFSVSHIRGNPKSYLILGHRDQIDFVRLKALFGPVMEISLDQLFGY